MAVASSAAAAGDRLQNVIFRPQQQALHSTQNSLRTSMKTVQRRDHSKGSTSGGQNSAATTSNTRIRSKYKIMRAKIPGITSEDLNQDGPAGNCAGLSHSMVTDLDRRKRSSLPSCSGAQNASLVYGHYQSGEYMQKEFIGQQ
jgi:hypothetical protein